MIKPKISVVMPVYNGQKYLRSAVDSIISQTFTDFEYIIIDDGSTDNTSKILSSYTDHRIMVITHPKNLGIVKSLNEGLARSKGDYIARMDADDISVPDRLEQQYRYMSENDDVVVCAGNIKSINEDGSIISGSWWSKESAHIEWSLIWGNVIPHPTVMLKKSALPKDMYRDYKYAEDYDLWLRMSGKGEIFRLDNVLVYYRLHNDHDGSSVLSMDEAYRSNIEWITSKYKIIIPKEHRWLSKFSQYTEDFGDVSFEKALNWVKVISQAITQPASNSQMTKIVLEACDKLVLKRKLVLLRKSISTGHFSHAGLIIIQTLKQYTRMILGIK